MTENREIPIRSLFSAARALEPSDALIAAVLARVPGPQPRTRQRAIVIYGRLAAPVVIALAVLAGGVYAVPATRAAIDDAATSIADVFNGWINEDQSEGPGRALRAGEQAPVYFESETWRRRNVREPRVIAEAGGYKLYAYRERNGSIGFDLGNTGVAAGGFTAAHFKHRSLFLLGPGAMPGPDERGHIPWFGLAARSVAAVEVNYETGPPLRVDHIDGAFVLLVEPDRDPRQAIATDAAGQVIGRQPFPGP